MTIMTARDDFNKKLTKIVLPMTIQCFISTLVPVSDAVMLTALDQDAMSAVSLAAQVAFVLQLFTFAVTAGGSMFAAQFWGNKDKASIEDLYALCVKLMTPISLIFFLADLFFPKTIMSLFTSVPEIIEYGAGYLRIVSFSYLLNNFTALAGTIMQNTGLIKPMAAVNSATVVINIFLNAVFIYGLFGAPRMEVRGAALATTLSTAIALLAAIAIQLTKGNVRFRFGKLFSSNKKLTKDFAKYTAPILGNQLSWGLGFTMISVIMGHLGSDAVAANSIAAIVKDLISCFCFALASGGAILIGNELGAGELERAKDYGSRICRLGLYSGIAAGVIIAAASPLIVRAVNLSETASGYLQAMLLMCVYYMVGRSMNSIVISGIFCSGGDTKFGFICDTVTMWCFIVPVGALAAFVLKLPVLAVFFILNLDEMVKLPAVYRHYKKYLWVRNLTDSANEASQ